MSSDRIVIFASVLLVGLPALGALDDGPRQNKTVGQAGKPDAREILRKVDKATRAVTAVSYDAEYFGTGGLAHRIARYTGAVLATQRRSLLGRLVGECCEGTRMRIEGKVAKPGTDEEHAFKVITNGKQVCTIDLKGKVFIKGDMPDSQELLGRGGVHPLWMIEYLHATPFSDEIKSKLARYEGETEIGGVRCNIVYVEYGDRNHSIARWYFGQEDNLPRRVDRIHNRYGEGAATVRIVTNLNTKPDLSGTDFCVKCPDGFIVKPFKPRPKVKIR